MNKKTAGLLLIAAIVILVLGWYANYTGIGKKRVAVGEKVLVQKDVKPLLEAEEVLYKVEEFATGLFVPWAAVFTSSNRLLITERSGAVRLVENNVLQKEPLIVFPEVSTRSEEGLMGMTLHPQYDINKRLYVCLAYAKSGALVDKIVELQDDGGALTVSRIVLDDIPAAQYHAGCRLKFGPDEKLYITTGDATKKEIAQDISSLGGKILRINDDGSIPADNPFSNSPVWSLGHRNPQGIAWHPLTDQLFATEHGPSGFDGPGGGDEVNIITKGGNYGWPIVSHEKSDSRFISPLLVFTPAEAPGGALFYKGSVFPQFRNNYFFGLLKGEGIMRVVLDEDDANNVVQYEKLAGVEVGRIRDVLEGLDGFIYFMTSNRDGRGEVHEGDDKIYRLVPK